MSTNNYEKINELSKGNRCSCCPYGCHVDGEFVQYCESLLSSLYGKQLSSAASAASSRGSFSLNHPPKRRLLSSTTSLPNDEATYQWLVDQNQNKNNINNNNHGYSRTLNTINNLHNNSNGSNHHHLMSISSPPPNGQQYNSNSSSSTFLYRLRPVGRSNSSSRVHDLLNPPSPIDKSLTDAVELFEKVLREHEQAAYSYSVPSSPAFYNLSHSPMASSTPVRTSFSRFSDQSPSLQSNEINMHLTNHHDPNLQTNSLPTSPDSANAGTNMRTFESQPSSPAGYLSINNNHKSLSPNSHLNNVNNNNQQQQQSPLHINNNGTHNNKKSSSSFLNSFRDQLQVSIQKMRDLEQQVKDIPVLKQKILILQAERKRLLQGKSTGSSVEYSINNNNNNPVPLVGRGKMDEGSLGDSVQAGGEDQLPGAEELVNVNLLVNRKRIDELEKSGLITPPLARRKLVLQSDYNQISDGGDEEPLNGKQFKSLKVNHSVNYHNRVNNSCRLFNNCATQTEDQQKNEQLLLNKQEIDYVNNRLEPIKSSSISLDGSRLISTKSESFKSGSSVKGVKRKDKLTSVSSRPSTLPLAPSSSSTSSPLSTLLAALSSKSSPSSSPTETTTTSSSSKTSAIAESSSKANSLFTNNNLATPKSCRSVGVNVNLGSTLSRRFTSFREKYSNKKPSEECVKVLTSAEPLGSPTTPPAPIPSPSFTSLPKPLPRSQGTDPISIESSEANTQTLILTLSNASVSTDRPTIREIGINFDHRIDCDFSGSNRECQTQPVLRYDKLIQVNEKCSNCELKQMETIGVGSGSIYTPPLASSLITSEVGSGAPETGCTTTTTTTSATSKMVDSMISSISSMASSFQSIKLCDKCNETITSLAKEVVIKDKQISSPGANSRIPRLANVPQQQSTSTPGTGSSLTSSQHQPSQQSSISPSQATEINLHEPNPSQSTTSFPIVPTNAANKIIIEEGNDDEFLVFRDPNAHLGSRKHRSNFPSMMTPQVDLNGIRLLEEACKITDSEESDEDDEPESFSSNEGTYILEDGIIVPVGRPQNRSHHPHHHELQQQHQPAVPSAQPINKSTNINARPRQVIEPSKELRAALKVLNDSLLKPDLSSKPATVKSLQIIEKEWFTIAACKDSDPGTVERYLDCFESYSTHLLNRIVNQTDSSGNTAMHYAISHSNFDVVSVLLDSKVCDVNKQNKAGYTAIIVVSTARVTNETHKEVIRRLFNLGDVNIRAKQNGQTALMLASSHGQYSTCKLLLEAGAALNVQDNDGSTALMCATEHGHVEIVKLLLSHPDCDPTIADNDKATAMTIAMECGRKEIAVLLYASCNMLSRGSSPYASLRKSKSKAITTQLKRTGSFTSTRSNQQKRNTSSSAPSPPTRSRTTSTITPSSTSTAMKTKSKTTSPSASTITSTGSKRTAK